jgi:hypothetical protein
MGNTGVALATDGAAPILNPATILRIRDDRLALSANFYGYEYTSIRDFYAPTPAPQNLYGALPTSEAIGRHKFTTLPSTFCIFLTLVADRLADRADVERPRHKLALCVASTERTSFNAIGLGQTLGETSQTRSLVRDFGRTQAGPTYALALGDRVALGASLFVALTSATWSTFGSTMSTGPSGLVTSSYERASDFSSWDLGTSLGVTYAIDSSTAVGARVTLPLGHLTGGLDATESNTFAVGGVPSAGQRSLTGGASAPTVPAIALGIGRELDRFRVEANATLHLPVAGLLNAELSGEERGPDGARSLLSKVISERGRPTLNMGVGLEVRATRSLGVLSGFATDFPLTGPLGGPPRLGELGYARRTRAVLSAGVASREGASELLIGAQLGLGWGKSLALDGYALPNELRLVDERSTSVLLIVAGNASLAGIRRSFDSIRGR